MLWVPSLSIGGNLQLNSYHAEFNCFHVRLQASCLNNPRALTFGITPGQGGRKEGGKKGERAERIPLNPAEGMVNLAHGGHFWGRQPPPGVLTKP